MVFWLGEPPRRFLFRCCIFICLCFSFCCCSFHCFSTSSLTLPWTIARVLHPFCTFSLAHRKSICNTFIFNHSVIFLPWALRFWVGIFYPQAFFTIRSFPTFLAHPDIFGTFPTFWHNLFLSRFHWKPAVTFLKVAGLHTDPRNTDPAHLFVWFTVIHNLLYILNLYLYMSILQKFLLVVKTLIKNMDQQPHYSAPMKIWSSSQTNQQP